MSQGLITGVANGSATVTVTYPAYSLSTTVPVTVTTGGGGGGGSITSISLFYNGQDVSTYGGMLLFTGNSYTLTAKDQAGNTLSSSSGSWVSTDPTNAPVSNAGVITPALGINTVPGAITFTHSASGVVGTVLFSVLKTPPALINQRGTPANTTALMAQISTNLNANRDSYNGGLPTATNNTGTAIYTDGLRPNHFAIDSTTTSRQFMGHSVMTNVISASGGGPGQMLTGAYSGFTRTFALQLLRFDPGFTMNGTAGGAAAFKIGNWVTFVPGGRVGAELTNGNGTHGSFDFGCGLSNASGTVVGGQSTQTTGSLTTEFTAGEVWVSLMLYEARGGNIMSGRMGWFKIGSVPNLLFGGIVIEGPMTGGPSPSFSPPQPFQHQPTTVNYNQYPPASDLVVSVADWKLVNGDLYGDPFGVLGANPTPTLTGISGGAVARGTTAASIVMTGTNFNINCHPVFSNTKIYPQSITINSSTQMTVVVAVNSGATPGAGTVLVNNQASQSNSATAVVTVT